jgi:hypothetical protein
VSIIDAPSEEAMMGAMANVVAAGNVSSTNDARVRRQGDGGDLEEGLTSLELSANAPARRC